MNSTPKRPIRVSFAVALLLAFPCQARRAAAQDSVSSDDDLTPPVIPELRDAPARVLGFDFGIGAFDGLCEDCTVTSGLALGLIAGAQIAPRVALLADASALVHPKALDSRDRGAILLTSGVAAARVWLIPTLWLQAGGGGQVYWSGGRGPDVTELSPAVQLAVGTEVYHRKHRGIDLQLRATGSRLPGGSGKSTFVAALATASFHWN